MSDTNELKYKEGKERRGNVNCHVLIFRKIYQLLDYCLNLVKKFL